MLTLLLLMLLSLTTAMCCHLQLMCKQAHLFNAMRKTTLIRPDVDVNNLRYSRCGRTDKGVSALGQVFLMLGQVCVTLGQVCLTTGRVC